MNEYVLITSSFQYEGNITFAKKVRLSFSKLHISSVSIYNEPLQKLIITKQVMGKYQKLLKIVNFYLDTDDDTGVAYQEALNEIERFRLIVKNKYRQYILEQQLKEMSKKLSFLQKKASKKLVVLQQQVSYQQERGKGGK